MPTANVACARMVKRGGGEYVIAALVFTLSPIHDDAHYVARRAQARGLPGHRCALHQGSRRPAVAASAPPTLIPAIKAADRRQAAGAACPLHHRPGGARLHGCAGLRRERAAVRLGRRRRRHLQSAVPSAWSPTCARWGTRCRVDDRGAGARSSRYFTRLAEAEGLPVGQPAGLRCRYLHHQLPGGMVGTMRRQLAESRLVASGGGGDRGDRPGARGARLADRHDAVRADRA